MSCKWRWRDEITRLRRSSAACNEVRRQAFHASRAATARTPSRSRSTVPRRRSTAACWSSRSSGVSACTGAVPSRVRRRPSPSRTRPTGGSVSFACAVIPLRPLPPTDQETGIDLGLGLEAFATLSDGARIRAPTWDRTAERSLANCQRRVSQRKRGSNRRRKAVCVLTKAQQTVRRQRQDFHHTTALALVRANDGI